MTKTAKAGSGAKADRSIPGNLKYGEAKERLETILAEIESAEVDVDDLAERVKEAAGLIRVLHDKLTRTKAEVEKAVADVKTKSKDDDDEDGEDTDDDDEAKDEDDEDDEDEDEDDADADADDDEDDDDGGADDGDDRES